MAPHERDERRTSSVLSQCVMLNVSRGRRSLMMSESTAAIRTPWRCAGSGRVASGSLEEEVMGCGSQEFIRSWMTDDHCHS